MSEHVAPDPRTAWRQELPALIGPSVTLREPQQADLEGVLEVLLTAESVHFGIDGEMTDGTNLDVPLLEIHTTGGRTAVDAIDRMAADASVSAMIIRIDSPGGTTTGSERLHDELRRLAKKKPVVAVVGSMAASGGYIAAMGADRILARGNSLVGSIGVLFQYPNVVSLLDKVGVKMESVKSSPLKAAPSGYEPTSPEARAALNALVVDSYDWFKAMVKDRRAMSDAELAAVSDGRVFTGRQGLGLKLVDAIGGEREAIEWLEAEKGVAKKLPVREWKKGRSLERLGLLGASAEIARFAGLTGLADTLQRNAATGEAQLLDGLLAIWQVEPAQ